MGPRPMGPRPGGGRARWSKGCSRCVKRRVKCDERRPGCGNCARYGQECPGYTRELVFLQGQTHRRAKASTPQSGPSTSRSPGPDSSISMSLVLASPASIPASINSPQLFQNQAVAASSEIILKDYRLIWSWFGQLPSLAGQSPVLDSAIQSFSLEMLGRSRSDDEILGQSRACYVQALSPLQRALYHPTEWQTSETLCASVLLCLFELYAGTTSSDDYLNHARGIGTLIEARGPVPEKWSSFDISLIQTFRSTLITASIFGGGHCTLTEERWRTFFRTHPHNFIPKPLYDFYEDYYDLFSEMPSVTHRGYALLQAVSAGLPIDPAEAHDLLKRTITVYEGWKKWDEHLLSLFPAPVEIPSPRGDSLYPVVYLYDDVWRGSSHIMVGSCIIIANMIFSAVGYGGDRAGEVAAMVDRICKSVETVSRGTCGPSRVGVGLRIAFEAASVETRLWIKGWLEEFEGRFAATNYKTYPARTARDIISGT